MPFKSRPPIVEPPKPKRSAIVTARKRIDVMALRALKDAMPMQPESAGDFVRRMRDEDRY
jgi:hypothetical protein